MLPCEQCLRSSPAGRARGVTRIYISVSDTGPTSGLSASIRGPQLEGQADEDDPLLGRIDRLSSLGSGQGATMRRHDNSLLSRIEPAVYDELAKHVVVIDLTQGDVIAEAHDTVEKVYFPHAGIISCVVEL